MKISETMLTGFANLLRNMKNVSPELLMGVGITGTLAAAVYACVKTLELEEIVDDHKDAMDDIHDAEKQGVISHDEAKKETVTVYLKTIGRTVKLYLGPVTVIAISLLSIYGSYHILSTRNIAATSALASTTLAFQEYRDRVKAAIGEEKEQKIFDNAREEIIETIDADGKKHKEKVTRYGRPATPYSVLFDETNPNWDPNCAHANQTFVACVQKSLNDLLHYRGWVTIADALDRLGFEIDQSDPHMQEFLNMGWTTRYDKFRQIDFGLSSPRLADFMDPDPFAKAIGAYLIFNVDPYPIWGHDPEKIFAKEDKRRYLAA